GVPSRHAAHARPDVRVRRGRDDDRLPAALRRAVRHDAGRTGGRDAERRSPHVRGRLSLVGSRRRDVGRVRALRGHPRPHGRAAPAPARGGRVRRPLVPVVLHAALAVIAAVTLLPLLWMVSASFMPTGEAGALPPRLLPSAPTLAHYRALFER